MRRKYAIIKHPFGVYYYVSGVVSKCQFQDVGDEEMNSRSNNLSHD